MCITIVKPSILLPRLRSEVLTRKRLLDLLYGYLERKLILVVAPAGYGKTSLLIDFAHQRDISACWYTVDQRDQDLRVFLAHFIASISRVYPDVGADSNAAIEGLHGTNNDIDRVVNTVVNEIYEFVDEHFVIILDDFQVVGDNQAINAFLSRFISRVSDSCHLAIATRQQPGIPDLDLLAARGQLGKIDCTKLAFTPAELQSLAQKLNYELTDQQISSLVEETEGWITGILLTPTTSTPRKSDFLRGPQSNGASLAAYWNLLLQEQTDAVRKLLLFTSLLDEFNQDLCQRLFSSEFPADTDWNTLLEMLLHKNLFVQPVGNGLAWLRYHNLFKEYLQAQLEREYPGRADVILRQLVNVYCEGEEWERAYTLSQQLSDPTIAMDVIEQAGPSLLKYGRFNVLTKWLDGISPGLLASRPGLLSLKGSVALMSHNIPQGMELLNQATAMQSTDDPSGLARTLVRRATGYQFMGDHVAALKDAEEALRLANQDDGMKSIQAQALKARGISLQRLDRSAEGIQDIQSSLDLYLEMGDKPNIASLYHELGIVQYAIGDLPATRAAFLKAGEYWRSEKDFYRLADLLNNLGVLHHQMGEYEQSISALDEGLKYARLTGFARLEAYILTSLGDLYADIQATQDAEDVFEEAQVIARRIGNRHLCFYTNHALAILACQAGDLSRALDLHNLATDHAQEEAFQEQGLLALGSAYLALLGDHIEDVIRYLNIAVQNFHSGVFLLEEIRVHLYLGAAYLKVGDEENSRVHLRFALEHISNSQPSNALLVASRHAIQALRHFEKDPQLGWQASRLIEHLNHLDTRLPEIRRKLRRHAVEVPSIQPKFVIRAFGTMQITTHGKTYNSLDWQSRTQRDLFFYLLQHTEGATKETLISLFWGIPDEHDNRLASALYKIRRFFDEEVILFRDNRYYFNRALDYDYDVETYLHYWAQVRQVVDTSKRLQLLHRMMDLYRGNYAVEAEGSWVVIERERLYQIYLQVVSTLVEQYLEQRDYERGLECCLRAIELDDCQEVFYRLAMRVSAARGDLAGVDHYYRLCRKALEKTHGIHLSEETHHLYQELLS